MKKPLFAMALLGASIGAAHAQSSDGSLTLYGVVDVNVMTQKGAKKLNSVGSGGLQGSRWGLKGSKSIDDSLKAQFQLEGGFDPDLGTSAQNRTNADKSSTQRLFGRQAWGGLSGGFGTIAAGRMYTPAGVAAEAIGTKGADVLPVAKAHAATGAGYRSDNALTYISPSMGGAVASLQVSPEADGGEGATTGEQMGLAVTYKGGPLIAGLGYTERKETVKGALVYGGYDFDVANVALAYNQDQKYVGGTYASKKPTTILLKVGVPLMDKKLNLSLQAGQVKDANASAATDDADIIALQATYNLIKTTALYAFYTDVKNKGVATLGYNSPDKGGKSNQIQVGLRHQF